MLRGAGALWLAACTLEPIDVSGKLGPCIEGYVELPTGRCCRPIHRPTDFRAAWTTPNAIRFEWEPDAQADPLALASYEIRFEAPDERTVDSTENPELQQYFLGRTGSGTDPVDATIVGELVPDRDYRAHLVARDRSGCAFESEALTAQTSRLLVSEISIYSDEAEIGGNVVGPSVCAMTLQECDEERPCEPGDTCIDGISVPLAVADDGGGGRHVEHRLCTELATEQLRRESTDCGNNLPLSADTSLADLAASGSGAFARAILEVDIAAETNAPADFARIWIVLGEGLIHRIEPISIPPSTPSAPPSYRRYQIPLRALRCSPGYDPVAMREIPCPSELLTFESIEAFSSIAQFNVGGGWTRDSGDLDARVAYDNVSIRY
jgi:hypothetical protein